MNLNMLNMELSFVDIADRNNLKLSTKSLDQFFTKTHVSNICVKDVLSVLNFEGISSEDMLFIEPSAGHGCFLDNLKAINLSTDAYDIEPQRPDIKQNDFLNQDIKVSHNKQNTIIIGNPPFGKAGRTALEFIIKGFNYSDFVCFILPNNFQKYSMQRLLPSYVKIIHQKSLPPKSFFTATNSEVDIGCIFQVLTRQKTKKRDKRIKVKPPIAHPDFILYQYNNTQQALKHFKEDFDIAIFNQGYGKYPNFKYTAKDCDKKKQWLLVKCKNKKITDKVNRMDFEKIANKNTTVKGFRKADFVEEYSKLYD